MLINPDLEAVDVSVLVLVVVFDPDIVRSEVLLLEDDWLLVEEALVVADLEVVTLDVVVFV